MPSQIKEALGFFNTFLLVFAGISLFVGALHHPQHVLDPRGPAHPGAGPAPGPGRQPAPGPGVGGGRGGPRRAGRVGSSASASGILVAIGPQGPAGRLRDRPARRRADRQAPHRHRLAGRGRAGHPGGGHRRRPGGRRSSRPWPPWAGPAPRAAGRCGGARSPARSSWPSGVAALGAGLFGDAGHQPGRPGRGPHLRRRGPAHAPLAAVPMASVLGRPLPRVFRSGASRPSSARQNALRNPRRTASTAAALTIGLGLVGCVAVLAASIVESGAAIIDKALAADYIVSTDQFTPTISTEVAHRLARAAGAGRGHRPADGRVQGRGARPRRSTPATRRRCPSCSTSRW